MASQVSHFAGLRDYMRILFTHLPLILIVFLGVVVVAAVGTFLIPPQYVATAKIIAKPGAPLNPLGMAGSSADDRDRFIETQKEIILSSAVAEKTLVALREKSSEFKDMYPPTEDPATLKGQIDSLRGMLSVFSRSNLGEAVVGGSEIGDSYVLNVGVQSTDPKLSALVANQIVEDYKTRYGEIEQSEASQSSTFLESQVKDAADSLEAASKAREDYEKSISDLEAVLNSQKGGVQIGGNVNDMESLGARLSSQMANQQRMIEQIDASLKKVREYIANPDKLSKNGDSELSRDILLMPEASASNASLSTAMDRVNELRLDLVNLTQQWTDEYPPVKDLRGKVREGLVIIADLLEQDMSGRKATLQGAIAESDVVNAKLKEYQARFGDLAAKKNRHTELSRAVEVADLTYRTRYGEFEKAKMAGALETSSRANIAIMDRATPPTHASSPNKKLNISLAAALGLVLALTLAFLVDSWDHSFRTTYEAERVLKMPVIAAISKQK